MRGSHPGAFEAAHRLRDGDFWSQAAQAQADRRRPTISSSSAAASAGSRRRISIGRNIPDARILILDNHDDFGGHAKRNEFSLDGRIELMNGGTLMIDSPRPYSAVADGLVENAGHRSGRAYSQMHALRILSVARPAPRHFPRQGNFRRRQADRRAAKGASWAQLLARRAAVAARCEATSCASRRPTIDYMPGLTSTEKKTRLAADELSRLSCSTSSRSIPASSRSIRRARTASGASASMRSRRSTCGRSNFQDSRA